MVNCIETAESSTMNRFCYDKRRRTLTIEFKHGGVYDYYDVPESLFDEMMTSESKGRFLSDRIRGRYHYVRLK